MRGQHEFVHQHTDVASYSMNPLNHQIRSGDRDILERQRRIGLLGGFFFFIINYNHSINRTDNMKLNCFPWIKKQHILIPKCRQGDCQWLPKQHLSLFLKKKKTKKNKKKKTWRLQCNGARRAATSLYERSLFGFTQETTWIGLIKNASCMYWITFIMSHS